MILDLRDKKGYISQPQIDFFMSRARHAAYGGARGGGKSWAMRRKFVLLACNYPRLKLLLLRRTMPELLENHIRPLWEELNGFATYKQQERVFRFPNGSIIKMGYCDTEKDVYQYQGQEYDVIGLEEATHFTEFQMQYLTTCNRNTRDDFTPRMYYTCNPGGVGHAWVKRLFIDRDYQGGERPEDYVFIPARVKDNKAILENDPEYIRALENLPEDLRRAYLDGDWNVFAGQYFKGWRQDIHVVEPFPIPDHWRRYRAIDYGLDALACVWAAFDELGQCWIYRDLKEANLIISEAARRVLSMDDQEDRAQIRYAYAPKDLEGRSKETGESVAKLFYDAGLRLLPVNNRRVDGWMNMAEWLKRIPDGTGGQTARLKVFSSCRNVIKDLPMLQHDERDVNDAATQPHDVTHIPDAIRYLLDGRPRCPDAPAVKTEERDERPSYENQVESLLDYGR